ncbi:MAG: SpoIIIAH-like family protein, partial [Lachnospiraceae bacterium]
MKGILKKNQIMITALAIMIAIAGYLNFTSNKIGEEEIAMVTTDGTTQITEADAADISLESVKQDELIDIESLDSEVALTSTDVAEDTAAAVDTAASVTTAAAATTATPDATPETPGEAVFTSSTVGNLASAKLVKEQTRAKNKEM